MDEDEEPIQIVRGILMTAEGEVAIDPKLDEPLCDLAIALQGGDDLAVDIEHVVAALILASRRGEVPSDYELRGKDRTLLAILKPHVATIFNRYGGRICEEDEEE